MTRTAFASGALALLLPLAASAQSNPPTPVNQGPMIVESVHSGWLAAPDIKVTEVDKTTSTLAGGYAGWLTDERLFIGGGGYWLANPSSDRKLAYGGVVVGWLMGADRRIGFGAKALVGGGEATLGTTVSELIDLPEITNGPGGRPLQNRDDINQLIGSSVARRVRFRQDFFVAEPEVDVIVRLARHLRLTGGVGYRAISADGRDGDRLRGTTGSVSLQLGGGF